MSLPPKIYDENGRASFGGSQMWLPDPMLLNSGCGIIAGLDAITRLKGEEGMTRKEYFDRFFEALISKGKALEINTKSIRKHIDGGFTRHLPDEAILNRYRAMGGNLICLGSDSHFPGTFGVCFDEAVQFLMSLGFKESVYFKAHKPVFEPL